MRTIRPRVALTILPLLAAVALTGCNAMVAATSNTEGQAYYRQGNYTMARNAFHRAAIDDPWNADYRHNLATAMKKQGDVAGAEHVWRQAIQTNPMHQPSYHALAQMLQEQNRASEAYQLLTAWRDTQPYMAAPNVEMAWLQRSNGDLAGAEQSLRQALRIRPNHPVALSNLGQLYQDTGRPQLASAMYRRSLAHNWNQPRVHSRLAMVSPNTRSWEQVTAPPSRYAYAQPAMTAWRPPATAAAWSPGSPYQQAYAQPQPTRTYSVPTVAAQPSAPTVNADPAHVSTAGAPVVVPH